MNRGNIQVFTTLLSIILCSVIYFQKGAHWRIPKNRIHLSASEMLKQESLFCKGTHIINGKKLGSNPQDPLITCKNNIGSQKDIYVWGDSHGRHLLPGLRKNFPSYNINILYYAGCMAQNGLAGFSALNDKDIIATNNCQKRNKDALMFFKKLNPTSIIIHQYFGYEGQFSEQWVHSTISIIDKLKAYGHNIIFLGGVIKPQNLISDCFEVPILFSNELNKRRCGGKLEIIKKIIERNKSLKIKFPDNFIDISSFFCNAKNKCRWFDNKEPLFRDSHHLSVSGSIKLIRYYKDIIKQKISTR